MAKDDAPEDLIRYDILAQEALRGVIRKVLGEVAKTGLPGNHHFMITFLTRAPGVRISSRLLARHPHEITVVIQHQYQDLTVTDVAFEVGLSFGGVPERLLVPYSAITAFGDPSVSFALQFQIEDGAAEIEAEADEAEKAAAPVEALVKDEKPKLADKTPKLKAAERSKPDEKPADGAAVVSLDAFRKKN